LRPTGPFARKSRSYIGPFISRGNAWSLFEQHSESGIRITPKTAQSLWLGEKMDDDMAIQVMLQLE